MNLWTGAESETLAKGALIILVVGLKGRWKAPVDHLIPSISAILKQQLLLAALSRPREAGLVIHNLTMYGHPSNVSMARSLGCKRDPGAPVQNYFIISETDMKVRIIIDPCRMFKQLRNTLHDYGVLIALRGYVRWDALAKLHTLQDDVGLRLANKVDERHIEPQDEGKILEKSNAIY